MLDLSRSGPKLAFNQMQRVPCQSQRGAAFTFLCQLKKRVGGFKWVHYYNPSPHDNTVTMEEKPAEDGL